MNLKNYLLSFVFLLVTTAVFAFEDSTTVKVVNQMTYEKVMPLEGYELSSIFGKVPNKKNTEQKTDLKNLESALENAFNENKQDFVSPPPPPPADNVSNGSIGGLLDDEIALIQKARETIATIQNIGSFVTKLGGETLQSFPVGISQEIDNTTFTLAVAGMKIFPGYSQLEVFLQVESPKLNTPLIFYSPDIKFTVGGGIVGGGSLGLLGDMSIDIKKERSILLLKRGITNNLGVFEKGTYVQVDCNGFKEFGLDAEVHFSRDWIKPVPPPPTNNPVQDSINIANDSTRVVGKFTTVVGGLDDILLNIDMDDFVAAGAEDVIWKVDTVIFDFSEERNDDNLSFPIVIADSLKHEPTYSNEMWQGFYMKRIEVLLPKRLTGDKELLIGGENIVIDGHGFSGKAYAASTPLLGLNEGNADGWAFSVNYFEVAFLYSDLKQIYFDGGINAPLFSKAIEEAGNTPSSDTTLTEADALSYKAFISLGNQYEFNVATNDTMAVKCWQAKATFYPNTSLNLLYDGQFTATATIFADIGIDGKMGKNSAVKIPEMHVEGMMLSNRSPYFKPGSWSMPDSTNLIDASIGAFSLSITFPEIEADNSGPKPLTNINFGVSLGLDAKLALEAAGDFTIVGELDTSGDRHKWRPKKFKINELSVGASFPGVDTLGGKIYFFDEDNMVVNDTMEFIPTSEDVNYGSGFRGELIVKFSGMDVQVEAIAQFGEIQNAPEPYKYFMVDVLATFKPGIPIGALEIQGFGGGVYRHMRRPGIDEAFGQLEEGNRSQIGASLSGIVYTPDINISLGIKLSVVIAIPPPPPPAGTPPPPPPPPGAEEPSSSFNANLSFGIEFGETNCTGDDCSGGFGIMRIWFQGNGKFMAPMNLMQVPSFPVANATLPGSGGAGAATLAGVDYGAMSEPANDASMSAYIMIDLNFVEKIYDGRAKVIVEMPGATPDRPLVQGTAWCAVHLDKGNDDWYIHVGTPSNRNDLSVDIILAQAQFTSYFMMGNKDIPSLPPPFDPDANSYTSTLAADMGFVYQGTRGTQYESGKGLIFGAGFHFASDFEFLFLKADIGGGMGFDVAIKKVVGDCNIADQVGIGGWYAKGQAWAYFFAKIKAEIKIGPFKGSVDIFEANAAALVKLEGPNPVYARAQIVGNINALGLVSGSLEFKFEIGKKLEDHLQELAIPEDCILKSGGLVGEIEIIESLQLPEDSPQDSVSTSIKPEIYLNFANRSTLQFFNDELERNEIYQIRIEYEFFENGEPMVFNSNNYSYFTQGQSVEWNDKQTEGVISFAQLLSQYSNITVRATAHFFGISGYHGIAQDSDGNDYYEVKELTFLTGGSPQYIDQGMVKYSYPYEGQQYLLKGETDKGTLSLEGTLDLSYLFDGSNALVTVEFFDKETGTLIGSDEGLSLTQGDAETEVPADSLDANGNLVTYMQSTNSPYQSFDFTMPTNDMENEKEYLAQMVQYAQDGGERAVLYEINFATSQFDLLAEKLATYEQVTESYFSPDATANDDKLVVTLEGVEPFDSIEWTPSFYHPDLHFSAVLPVYDGTAPTNPGWYETEAQIMYENVYGQATNEFTSSYYDVAYEFRNEIEVFPNFTEPNKMHIHYKVPNKVFDDYMFILGEIQVWDSLFAESQWADFGNSDSLQLFNETTCQLLHPNSTLSECLSGMTAESVISSYLVDTLGYDTDDPQMQIANDSILNVIETQVSSILVAQQSDGIASLCDLAIFGTTMGHQYFGWASTPGTTASPAGTNSNPDDGSGGPAPLEPRWYEEDIIISPQKNSKALANIPNPLDADKIPNTWEELEVMYNNLPQWIVDLSCDGGGSYIGDLYGLDENGLSGAGKYKLRTRYRIPTTNDIYDTSLEIEKSAPAPVATGGGTIPNSSTSSQSAGSSGPSSN